MTQDPLKKTSLLAPIEELYDPAAGDSDRVLARIRGSLATEGQGGLRTATLKVAVLACCVAAFVGGAIAFRTNDGAPAPPAPAATSSSSREDAPPGASSAAAPIVDESPPTDSTPISVAALPEASASAAPSRKDRPASVATVRSSSATEDSLEREASLLAGAKRALRAGDGERALTLLDEHARLFPDGWLKNDRAAERILTLCSLGRREQATHEGHRFLEGRAPSPLTRRVMQSCAMEKTQ